MHCLFEPPPGLITDQASRKHAGSWGTQLGSARNKECWWLIAFQCKGLGLRFGLLPDPVEAPECRAEHAFQIEPTIPRFSHKLTGLWAASKPNSERSLKKGLPSSACSWSIFIRNHRQNGAPLEVLPCWQFFQISSALTIQDS